MYLVELSEEYKLPVKYLIFFFDKNKIFTSKYTKLTSKSIEIFEINLELIRGNFHFWQLQENIKEKSNHEKVWEIFKSRKVEPKNFEKATINNIANLLNINQNEIFSFLEKQGYIFLNEPLLSKSSFIEIQEHFDKFKILDIENFAFFSPGKKVRKETIFYSEFLAQKYEEKKIQNLLKQVYEIKIVGDFTRYESDFLEVILHEAYDVFLSHINHDDWKQHAKAAIYQNAFDRVQKVEVIGNLIKDEFELLKSLILESLIFRQNCSIKSDLFVLIKSKNQEKIRNVLEYCNKCNECPCRCHIINQEENSKYSKQTKKESRINYYDEDATYCGACQHKPCNCSDKERTSMTL